MLTKDYQDTRRVIESSNLQGKWLVLDRLDEHGVLLRNTGANRGVASQTTSQSGFPCYHAVLRMIALEHKPRNAAMLRLFYSGGLRVSELCSLRWRDLQPRGDAGQVVVPGKGSKTRSVLISPSTWAALQGIHGEAGPDDPVFLSQK
jgi:integrase